MLSPGKIVGWCLGTPLIVVVLIQTEPGQPASWPAWAGVGLIHLAVIAGLVRQWSAYPAGLKLLHAIQTAREANPVKPIDRERVACALTKVKTVVTHRIPLGRWTSLTSFHDRVIYAQRRRTRLALMARVEAVITDARCDWAGLEDDVWRLLFRVHARDWLTICELGTAAGPHVTVHWREDINSQVVLGVIVALATVAGVLISAF